MASAERLVGGWNSLTWLVHSASGIRYVAKLADVSDADAFRGGLLVAELVASHGVPSGAPVPAGDGSLSLELPEGVLALLEYVPGAPPEASSEPDLRRAGAVLARAHHVLADGAGVIDERHRWPWAWAAGCLADDPMPPEVRVAAWQVLDEAREVTARESLRVGVVHGDPALDAFRLGGGPTGSDGLIDWAGAMQAPVVFDLAVLAVQHRDNPRMVRHCLDGYLKVAPAIQRDLEYLDAFVRLRYMCHAIYFADRIARQIIRGAGSAADNERLLAEAYAGMRGELSTQIV